MNSLNRLALLSKQVSSTQMAWKSMVFGLDKTARFSTAETMVPIINSLRAGVCINPHHQKRHKGGEDAATVTNNMLAVADGVGGWAESGVDPAIYSKRLC